MIIFRYLGFTKYEDCLNIQLDLVGKKILDSHHPDYFILTEHDHVFTLGKAGKINNLIEKPVLENGEEIPLYHVERGGDITYHGPGQLVVYPIIDLKKCRITITELLWALEECVIRALERYGVKGERSPINRGIFVRRKKVAFIGMAVKKGITYHGMSINISPDLTYFSYINPCGFSNLPVTSLESEIHRKISVPEIAPVIEKSIASIFKDTFLEV